MIWKKRTRGTPNPRETKANCTNKQQQKQTYLSMNSKVIFWLSWKVIDSQHTPYGSSVCLNDSWAEKNCAFQCMHLTVWANFVLSFSPILAHHRCICNAPFRSCILNSPPYWTESLVLFSSSSLLFSFIRCCCCCYCSCGFWRTLEKMKIERNRWIEGESDTMMTQQICIKMQYQ